MHQIENKKRGYPFETTSFYCGGYRTRTDHLKHAMLALYQMS